MTAADATPARLSVRIREVPALAGLRWIRLAWRAFARQPGGFMGLFGMFLLCVLLLALPMSIAAAAAQALGASPLALMPFSLLTMPLATLGFMLATEAVVNDLRIRPGLMLAPLRGAADSRRSLLAVGLVYVATLYVAYFLGNGLDDGAVRTWMVHQLVPVDPNAAAEPMPGGPGPAVVLALKAAVVALASIPLWHAPPLVYWGGQRLWPALFASTVALWRTRAAFAVFLGGWFLVGAVVWSTVALLQTMLPGSVVVLVVSMALSWALSAVFYITLWFGFQDTFDIVAVGPAAVRRATPG
jgi:hypothetical protein